MLDGLLHLRYKPRENNFSNCEECPAFSMFDWVIWSPDDKRLKCFRTLRPKNVLCLAHPSSLKTLYSLRIFLSDITLIIAGEDTNLSEVLGYVEKLVPYCRKIYYEAKDIKHNDVSSFSMGFNSYYLKRLGEENILSNLKNVRSPGWRKEGVLVAWGAIWKHLDKSLSGRREAAEFVEQCDWLEREDLNPESYLRRLSESKYLFAPEGQGVQAPKLAEAWLMRTVPIVVKNPCFQDLSGIGYPMVMLDDWRELTPEMLHVYEQKRKVLDWDKVYNMLTLKYFVDSCLG